MEKERRISGRASWQLALLTGATGLLLACQPSARFAASEEHPASLVAEAAQQGEFAASSAFEAESREQTGQPSTTATPASLWEKLAPASPTAREATAPPTLQPAQVPTTAPTPTSAPQAAQAAPAEEPCPSTTAARQDWRAPLEPAPLWNPPGPKRVGLQAGHWQVDQVPPELAGLGQGTSGGGKREPEVTLDLAQRAASLLAAEGVAVDILPATVPPRYRAHAFVSIHTDGSTSPEARGYKLARPAISSIPAIDDDFVALLHKAYGVATALPTDDDNITPAMQYYYAFNSRRFCHAVAPGVPQVILETGFLTSPADREILIGQPERAARGIADGVLAFLRKFSQS